MSKHSRLQVLVKMKEIGIIPVYYNADKEVALKIALACAEGGAKAIEFTNRGDRAIEVFTHMAEYRDKERPDLILGVGSVCDAPTAGMYISAGADFVVGPLLDEDAAKICNKRKVPYSPGCGSLTEIHKAHELGVEIVKIFPGRQVGGPDFVKAVKGPCPWTEIMPTGGVSPTEDNLTEWFNAGVACVGMGSKLITKELVQKQDFQGLTEKVKKALEIVASIRNKKV